jgi:ssDNA-binding replication factor A large subunit
MIGLTYEQIIERIQKEKNISLEDIEIKVKIKLKELSDLISREGAAYIVANELGIKLFEDFSKKTLKINQLIAGIGSLNIVGKVLDIYQVREFNSNNRKGRVASLLFGDETGTCRVVFWDLNHIKEIENGNITRDKVIKVKNAYVKENNGFKEIHLGNRASLDLNPEEKIESVNTGIIREVIKKQIKDLIPGEFASISGTIVQAFEPRFYDACAECGKKVNMETMKCEMHPNSLPNKMPIFNFFLDDGTENIRLVAFRDNVVKLIGNINEIQNNPNFFDDIRANLLGTQYSFTGKVTKNEMFDRKEFIISSIEEIKPEEAAQEIIEEIDV